MTVESAVGADIVPVTPDLYDRVLPLAPAPGGEVFSGVAGETLPTAWADSDRTPYAITVADEPVGFFVLDAAPSPADPGAGLTLRALFVDARFQGRGIAGATLVALPALIRARHRGVVRTVLTVNCRNEVARSLYLRHGWIDTGELYLGGDAGPQHVLTLEL